MSKLRVFLPPVILKFTMASAKDTPRRRSSDGVQGLRTKRGSDISSGRNPEEAESDEVGRVRYDVKGNGIWEWATEHQRRRDTDRRLDYLKVLGGEGLTLTKDETALKEFNPYSSDYEPPTSGTDY